MSKGRRKSKIKKQPKSPRIVSATKATETAPLPPGMGKLAPDRAVVTSKEIFIAAPVELCFDTLTSQLEQPRQWDLVIVNTRPVSTVRGRIGATSQVTLNLGGKERQSLAMISRYRPNRAISWVLAKKPKAREDWQLELVPRGTTVSVTLAYEVPGWVIGHLLDKIMRRKKVEHDLDKTLTQLKAVVESTSRDQRTTGKWRL